jgi:D-alanine-D-alanine ligase
MNVSILFNEPIATGIPGGFLESDAGILEQTRAVETALRELEIPYETKGIRSLRELPNILNAQTDGTVIFNLIETVEGCVRKAAFVPSWFDVYRIPYTGNPGEGLLLSADKWRSKAILSASGLPCPEALRVEPGETGRPSFPGPWIVKPAATDASEGIDDSSVIRDDGEDLARAVARVHAGFGQAALIEQFIQGRELNVSVLTGEDGPHVLPLAEIDFSAFSEEKPRIVGYDAKWRQESFEYNHTPRVIPAPLPGTVAERVRTLAVAACAALACEGYCRVDFRLDAQLNPYILEVNANPDISADAGLAAALDADGIPYQTFIQMLLSHALKRANRI